MSQKSSGFTLGGKVQAQSGLYIEREADRDLLEVCRAGNIGIVLHSRQVGKSSLVANVASHLEAEDILTVVIDMTRLGAQEVSVDQWYRGLLVEIADQCELDMNVGDWLKEIQHDKLPRVQLLSRFARYLLTHIERRIVLFLDEIDTTVSLNFTDDFFAGIRDIYQSRDREPEFQRLSFVLVGSSSPDELMRDPNRTPFNVGVRIDIKDFTLDESKRLASNFPTERMVGERIIEWAYAWTNGHPYLTQVACDRLARLKPLDTIGQPRVDEVIREVFFRTEGTKERNLNFVREMLTTRAKRVGLEQVLRTYLSILRGARPKDDGQVSALVHLKLSGVVTSRDGALETRNRIYREVFDERWVKAELPYNWRPLAIGVISALTLLITGGVLYFKFEIRPAQARQEQLAYWTAALENASSEREARDAFKYLVGAEPDPKLGERLAGSEDLAAQEFKAFWERRAKQFDALAATAEKSGDTDAALMFGVAAAIKRGNALPEELLTAFNARYAGVKYRLRGSNGRANAVRFAEDGSAFLTASSDGELRLWNAADGRPLTSATNAPKCCGRTMPASLIDLTLEGPSGYVVASSRTPPIVGYLVAQDRTGTFNFQKQLPEVGERGRLWRVAVSPDRQRLLVAGSTLQLYRAPSGNDSGARANLLPSKCCGAGVWDAAFSPDGRLIAAASDDGSVTVLRADGSSKPRVLPSRSAGAAIHVDFSADANDLIAVKGACREAGASECSATPDTVEIWSLVSGARIDFFPHEQEFVTDSHFCGTGDSFVTVARGRNENPSVEREPQHVRLWRRATRKSEDVTLGEDVLAVDRSCSKVVTTDSDGTTKVRELASQRQAQPRPATAAEAYSAWRAVLRLSVTEAGETVPLEQDTATQPPEGPTPAELGSP